MGEEAILVTEKEKEVIKSCIYMALIEGLYHFSLIDLDASEDDVKGVLKKLGMSDAEAEKFIRDAW